MTPKIYRTFRELRDDLGKIDASFAYIAMSLKHLDESASISGNRLNFMKEVAVRHSFRVILQNDVDPQRNVFFSAAVAVHSEWDRFLTSLMVELGEFGYEGINKGCRRKDESRLSFFLRLMKDIAPGKLNGLPQYLIDLCEYLRLLRNYYAHGLTSPQKDCVELYNKIKRSVNTWHKKFGTLRISSKSCDLTFDDILILTIAVKLLAEEICSRLAPDPEMLIEYPATKEFILRERNLISESSVQLFLYDRFGLDRDTAKQLSEKVLTEALV